MIAPNTWVFLTADQTIWGTRGNSVGVIPRYTEGMLLRHDIDAPLSVVAFAYGDIWVRTDNLKVVPPHDKSVKFLTLPLGLMKRMYVDRPAAARGLPPIVVECNFKTYRARNTRETIPASIPWEFKWDQTGMGPPPVLWIETHGELELEL